MMYKKTKLVNYLPEPLINYLPEFLRDIREYRALTATEDFAINAIWEGIEKAFKDQTVDTATEYGLGRLEKILNITPKSEEEADRKFEIKARLGQQLPHTMHTLDKMLTELCKLSEPEDQPGLKGYKLEVFPEEYTLKVLIDLRNKSKISAIDAMIRQICPANMLCLVGLAYNTHGALRTRNLTYAQLSGLTHEQIREDVLDGHFP